MLVVKVGTKTLLNGGSGLDAHVAACVASQVSTLVKQGTQVVLVTSGAIVAGKSAKEKTRWFQRPDEEELSESGYAGIGALPLLSYWQEAFLSHNVLTAQTLVTFASLFSAIEGEKFIDSILEYMRHGIIPIVNENDVLSDAEIRAKNKGISDNDWLASEVARKIKASAILFLSDEDGLYERNPKEGKPARRYVEVDRCHTPEHLLVGATDIMGRGGVESKVIAANQCAGENMTVAIAKLKLDEDTILKFMRRESVGTKVCSATYFEGEPRPKENPLWTRLYGGK